MQRNMVRVLVTGCAIAVIAPMAAACAAGDAAGSAASPVSVTPTVTQTRETAVDTVLPHGWRIAPRYIVRLNLVADGHPVDVAYAPDTGSSTSSRIGFTVAQGETPWQGLPVYLGPDLYGGTVILSRAGAPDFRIHLGWDGQPSTLASTPSWRVTTAPWQGEPTVDDPIRYVDVMVTAIDPPD